MSGFARKIAKYFLVWIWFLAAGIVLVGLHREGILTHNAWEIVGWVVIGASLIDALDIPMYLIVQKRMKDSREASYQSGYNAGVSAGMDTQNFLTATIQKLTRKNQKLKHKNKKLRKSNKRMEKFIGDVEVVPTQKKLVIEKVIPDAE